MMVIESIKAETTYHAVLDEKLVTLRSSTRFEDDCRTVLMVACGGERKRKVKGKGL